MTQESVRDITFQLGTRYQLEVPKGTISETGHLLIQRYISEQVPNEGEWKEKNPDTELTYLYSLPYDWDWVWKVEDGDYRGTFPKRVGKYYYKQFQLKAPDSFLAHIGNIAREHSETEAHYDFEFVDDFNWQSGDFGDDDSCFWGGRTQARKIMRENGTIAIRFYQNDEGKARAWVYPQEDDGTFIVFNGYGFLGNATLTIAKVMSQFFGLRYKQIRLTNWDVDDMMIWINSGIGYLIGTEKQVEAVTEHNFQWGAPGADEK